MFLAVALQKAIPPQTPRRQDSQIEFVKLAHRSSVEALASDDTIDGSSCFEAAVVAVDYIEHPLETVLKWIDRLLLWVERQWQGLRTWVKKARNDLLALRRSVKLVIGNKNYSSWSLRAWLLLAKFELEFEEVQESLKAEGLTERLKQYSPTGRVPVLIDGDLTVWDTLAIAEYVSERYLDGTGWPKDRASRAEARAVCCEMHAGFMGLRSELPMNCRAMRRVEMSALAKADIARVDAIWSKCMSRLTVSGKGPWLYGDFSIADCFYAPVVLRFKTYGVSLSEGARRYQDFFFEG